MSSSRLLRNVQVVEADAAAHREAVRFNPAFTPSITDTPPPSASRSAFPRTAAELEQVIAQRIAQVEAQRRAECDAAFQKGIEEGLRRRHQSLDAKLEAARRPVAQLAQAFAEHLSAEEQALVRQVTEIAGALTRCLVGRIVEVNAAAFLPALRDALEPLGHMSKVRVRMHPRDLETLRDALGDDDVIVQGLPDVELVADPQIGVGGAVAESRGGSVDARIEARMEAALALLKVDQHAG